MGDKTLQVSKRERRGGNNRAGKKVRSKQRGL